MELEALLDQFANHALCDDPSSFIAHFDGGEHSFHVVFGSIVHGNEVGSVPAMISAMDILASGEWKYGGKVSFFLGNVPAAKKGVRFLEADLNRVFTDEPPDCLEGHRARLLKELLATADLFLDFHQTIRPTERPFYIFPWSQAGEWWARAIQGASSWITRSSKVSFSPGTCCADEFVRKRGKPGITLELGHQGFHQRAVSRAERAMTLALKTADQVHGDPDCLRGIAESAPSLSVFHTVHAERFADPSLSLRSGLCNFQPVMAGEDLSDHTSKSLLSPVDGWLMFPKYPSRDEQGSALEPRPGEIYRVVQECKVPPGELFGSTDG